MLLPPVLPQEQTADRRASPWVLACGTEHSHIMPATQHLLQRCSLKSRGLPVTFRDYNELSNYKPLPSSTTLVMLWMVHRTAVGEWKHLSFHSINSQAVLSLWLRLGCD